MLSLLVLAVAGSASLVPTDDIWVYPHASDQKDAYLRVWGAEGGAVAPGADAMDSFSYSYLKFDLAKVPADAKIVGATLTLTHIADPGWTAALTKDSPIEVRAVVAGFSEKTWDYANASKWLPAADSKSVLGAFSPQPGEAGKTIQVTIDLLKGPGDFRAALAKAKADGALGLALTSTMDPAVAGRSGVYKFYSKDEEKESRRPTLSLRW